MLHRDKRVRDAGHCANRWCPNAGRVHDHLALDIAVIGRHGAHRTIFGLNALDAHNAADARAAVACTLGQGKRQPARVDVAVERQVHRAEHAAGIHDWKQGLCFFWANQFKR